MKQSSTQSKTYNAHGGEENLLLLPSALAETSDNLPRASRAQRVAERNGAAADVHLAVVNLERVLAVDCHAGESLVQLDNVDVVDGNVELAQKLGNGNRGANTHDAGSQAGNGGTNKLGHNGLAKLNGLGTLHEKDGRSCNLRELDIRQQ